MIRSTTIEIVLTQGSQTNSLGLQSLLEDKKLTAIAVLGDTSQYSPQGRAIASPNSKYLNLQNKRGTQILFTPLDLFEYTGGSPLLNYLPQEIQDIAWQQSSIDIAQGQAGSVTTNTVIVLIVWFEDSL